MKCPNCEGVVDITLLNIERKSEEDSVEVNFKCPWCRVEQFTILYSNDFIPVD